MSSAAAASGPLPDLDLRRIEVFDAVGRGAKGVVFLVREEGSSEFWALKVILRDNIEKNKKKNREVNHKSKARGGDVDEYRRVSFEQEVLSRFDHPLLPKLRAVLSTHLVVGYAIDYCPGSDLNALRRKQTEKMFSDDAIRFYAAELVLALEYLHSLGIVYRDLKPENVMIQENGHVMLVDFDLSTRLPPQSNRASPTTIAPPPTPPRQRSAPRLLPCFKPADKQSPAAVRSSPNSVFPAESSSSSSGSNEKSNSFVGTEEYVAPEVILGDGHDYSVDWWSLGVLLHEMLYGETPFRGSNRKETFYRILTRRAELVGETTPLRDLIGRLLEKDPRRRIGAEGIKGHDFFRGMDWDAVLEIQRPPFVPHFEEVGGGNGAVDVEAFVQRIFAARNKVGEDDEATNNNNVNNNNNNNNNNNRDNDFLVF